MTLQRRFYTTSASGSYTGPEPVPVSFKPTQILRGRNAYGIPRKHTQIGFQTDLRFDVLNFKWKFTDFGLLMQAARLDPAGGVLSSPAFTDSADRRWWLRVHPHFRQRDNTFGVALFLHVKTDNGSSPSNVPFSFHYSCLNEEESEVEGLSDGSENLTLREGDTCRNWGVASILPQSNAEGLGIFLQGVWFLNVEVKIWLGPTTEIVMAEEHVRDDSPLRTK